MWLLVSMCLQAAQGPKKKKKVMWGDAADDAAAAAEQRRMEGLPEAVAEMYGMVCGVAGVFGCLSVSGARSGGMTLPYAGREATPSEEEAVGEADHVEADGRGRRTESRAGSRGRSVTGRRNSSGSGSGRRGVSQRLEQYCRSGSR